MQVIEVVCCKLTELQQNLYNHFLKSKATRKLVSGQKSAGVLSAITNLKKLCNHPKLIYDGMHHVDKEKGPPEGFEVLSQAIRLCTQGALPSSYLRSCCVAQRCKMNRDVLCNLLVTMQCRPSPGMERSILLHT